MNAAAPAMDLWTLRGALASWRSSHPMDDAALAALIGVGNATCERIELGEVDPDDALAARIHRIIFHSGREARPLPQSRPDRARQSVSPHGTGTARGGGGPHPSAATPNPLARASRPRSHVADRPQAWLARRDGGADRIELLAAGQVVEMTIGEARGLSIDLFHLLAVHDAPVSHRSSSAAPHAPLEDRSSTGGVPHLPAGSLRAAPPVAASAGSGAAFPRTET